MAATKEEQLKKILEEFINATGVVGAAVVSSDGLMMASQLPQDVDSQMIAAMAASLFGTSNRVANELAIGSLEQTIIEAKKGKIIACATDNSIIIALISQAANIGLIMLELGKISERIRVILE